jgi:HK97 family phage portal protein
MVVRTRNGADRELRVNGAAFQPASSRIPSPMEWDGQGWGGGWLFDATPSTSGQRVNVWTSAGIPAVLKAIRTVAGGVAGIPVRIYQGRLADKQLVEASWQWRLLHDRPNDEQSRYDFWWDVAASVETHGNAFILKDKTGGGEVSDLYLLDPAVVRVERLKGTLEKVFVIASLDGPMTLGTSEVLHVRGPTLKGGMDYGLSPIRLEREVLGASLARYSHEGHSYAQGASIPFALKSQESMNRQKALETLAIFKSTHAGGHNAGNPAMLTNGTDIVKLGITMEDAQFIQSHEFGIQDIARMFNLPASMLGGAGSVRVNVEQETTLFLSFGLRERLDRVLSAVATDPDLFPPGSPLYPEHYLDEFIRVDAATSAAVRHQDVQSGVLLPDEARADMGRPPLPDGIGQIPQLTPVGGAPNPLVPAANGSSNGSTADS